MRSTSNGTGTEWRMGAVYKVYWMHLHGWDETAIVESPCMDIISTGVSVPLILARIRLESSEEIVAPDQLN